MPYIGEIRLFANTRVQAGWLSCDGSMLPVGQHRALFSLIGNSYGGDGVNTFCLPNLAGRTVYCIDFYNNPNGTSEITGAETVTLDTELMPLHSHNVVVPANEAPMASSANGTSATPSAGTSTLGVINDPAVVDVNNFYNNEQPDTVLNTGLPTPTLSSAGSASPQPISIMQPYLVLNYCICTTEAPEAIYPQAG